MQVEVDVERLAGSTPITRTGITPMPQTAHAVEQAIGALRAALAP